MADPNDEQEPGEQPDSETPTGLRKQIAEQAARAKAAEERLAAMESTQRELALHKASLAGLNEDQQAAFWSVHKGELTPESLAETAQRLGFNGSTPVPQAASVQQPDTGLAAQEQFAAGGTTVEPPKDGDTEFIETVQNWTKSRAELDAYIWEQNASRLTP